MTLSPTGLCSFCDSFDIRVFAGHSCFRFGQRCEDVVSGALDGCSFCCLILSTLTPPEKGIASPGFWLRRVRKQQRQRRENLSPSLMEVLKGFRERFIWRGHWINPVVSFQCELEKHPQSNGMGITGMQLRLPHFLSNEEYSGRDAQVANFNVAADIGQCMVLKLLPSEQIVKLKMKQARQHGVQGMFGANLSSLVASRWNALAKTSQPGTRPARLIMLAATRLYPDVGLSTPITRVYRVAALKSNKSRCQGVLH